MNLLAMFFCMELNATELFDLSVDAVSKSEMIEQKLRLFLIELIFYINITVQKKHAHETKNNDLQ